MRVGVDVGKSRIIGRVLGKAISGLTPDDFTDSRYYPPRGASRETVASYFLVMVAMDHRLSRPGRPYEGYVDGEFYHGADLLYRLGAKRLEEDPDFFTAERLSRISVSDVIEWLTVEYKGRKVTPPDPQIRAALLRDLGIKLQSLYDGSAYEIIATSRGYLRSGGIGFIERLKVFMAYQDPVEKKAFLLAKFLERRGVLNIVDTNNKEVPIDNHLTRIAIRTGMITLDEEMREAVAAGRPFTWEEDVMIRIAARIAYKEAARAGGIDPFIMDDFLWMFGRRCCTRESPVCQTGCTARCRGIGGCQEAGCVVQPYCLAASEPLYMLPEHTYLDTWYY